jgi:tetratricopeptide (TPR) repeat protein
MAMLRLGRMEEGISRLEEIVEADPGYPGAHNSLGLAYFKASRGDDAVAEMRKAVALSKEDPYFKGELGRTLALTGNKTEASSALDELEKMSARVYVSDVQIAAIQYCLGKENEAFENLEKAFRRKSIDLPDVRLWSGMDNLRADPRWVSIEARMGLRNVS